MLGLNLCLEKEDFYLKNNYNILSIARNLTFNDKSILKYD